MSLRREEEASLVNLYIPCTFLGCPRYFCSNGSLTKHLRSFHPDWTLEDEEGLSLDSEHL